MTKSRRYLKRRREIEQCTTKVKYDTREEAWGAACQLGRETGCKARAYRCPGQFGEPRHFHVTGGRKW